MQDQVSGAFAVQQMYRVPSDPVIEETAQNPAADRYPVLAENTMPGTSWVSMRFKNRFDTVIPSGWMLVFTVVYCLVERTLRARSLSRAACRIFAMSSTVEY